MLQTQQDFDATLYAWAIPKALSELEERKKNYFLCICHYICTKNSDIM